MAVVGPTALVAWMGGYDLAGVGAITEIEQAVMGKFADVTPLGPNGAIKHQAPLGCVEYSLREKGYLADSDMSLRRLLASGATAQPWASVISETGGATGGPCTIATQMRIESKSIPADREGFTTVDIGYQLDEGGDVYEDAEILIGGIRTGIQVVPPYSGVRIDFGSGGHSGGIAGAFQVAPDVVFDGATNLEVDMVHSNSLNTGWAVYSNTYRLAPATPQGPLHVFWTRTATTRRYVALRHVWNGTPGGNESAKIIAAIKRL